MNYFNISKRTTLNTLDTYNFNTLNIKETLYKHCADFVNSKLHTIEKSIASHKKSLESETKSSAGDKHETGRAMVQLEMEKAGQQLQNVSIMQTTLAKIDVTTVSTIARLGSLVYTSQGIYYLSVSVGIIKLEKQQYFAVSTQSPIGKLFLGKQVMDIVTFNGKQITILEIV